MFRGKTLGYGLVLVLAAAGSLALLRPRFHEAFNFLPKISCSKTGTPDGAYRADLHFLSGLGPESNLVQLTDDGESAAEIVSNLNIYRALVVVTAGRSRLTRRAEGQPFISVVHDELGLPQHQEQEEQQGQQEEQQVQQVILDQQERQQQQEQREQQQQRDEQERRRALRFITDDDDNGDGADDEDERQAGAAPAAAYDSGLAALAAAADVMNSAAAGLERVLGRRLFPISISLYDRTAGGTIASGPYAIFDASAGKILLDRHFVSYTWGDERPQVSYIAGQLASRVFAQLGAMIRTASPNFTTSASAFDAAAEQRQRWRHRRHRRGAARRRRGGGGAARRLRCRAAALVLHPVPLRAGPPGAAAHQPGAQPAGWAAVHAAAPVGRCLLRCAAGRAGRRLRAVAGVRGAHLLRVPPAAVRRSQRDGGAAAAAAKSNAEIISNERAVQRALNIPSRHERATEYIPVGAGMDW